MRRGFNKRYIAYFAMFILYSIFGIFFINYIANIITDDHYQVLGESVLDKARILSKTFKITDAEVLELKKLDFSEVPDNPINMKLGKYFKGETFGGSFSYVYLLHKLENNEVKYYVTEETSAFYEQSAGFPLNYMWLMDIDIKGIMGDTETGIGNAKTGYTKDQNRYTYLRTKEISDIFQNKEANYCQIKDEYGLAIAGFVPIYSEENTFVGLLGVDVDFDVLVSHVSFIEASLFIIFILPSIILSVIFFMLHLKENGITTNMSETDVLTTLKNRRYMDKKFPVLLKLHCKNKECFSIIMIDIDNFKKYNDSYGHLKGDEVLVQVSVEIRSVLRKDTDTICRYGGEEIIVLMNNTDTIGAINVAGKIQKAVRELNIAHEFSDCAKFITISQGVYSNTPRDWTKHEQRDFIEYADKALYEAKNTGRNKYVVSNHSVKN